MTRHPLPSDPPVNAAVGSVLCVEDHPISMALIEKLLTSFSGVTLSKATTGREGVSRALADRPDLILLDMSLPDISGLEVVRLLCDEISSRKLTVVLVTADSFSIDVIKAMTLGAREYWMKPLTIDKLAKDLPRALQYAQEARARSAQR
jgi:CheY-like chemotaxis protein